MNGKILIGDVLEKIKEIPDESIDCIITSPPYWGLRDYGTGSWKGGDPNCDHSEIRHKTREERKQNAWMDKKLVEGTYGDERKWTSNACPSCGAERVDAQWGLELDFHDYLDKLDLLMDECKRVLKKTGTCWINLGDTYSTISGGMRDLQRGVKKKYGKIDYGVGHAHSGDDNKEKASAYSVDQSKMYEGLKTKSRMGMPERFYIRCIDKGWVARNHIPWVKANSMPSSVKDRFTNKWESIFFFAKNPKYYFNLDAVRVPPKGGFKPFNRRVREAKRLKASGNDGAILMAKMSDEEEVNTNKNGFRIAKYDAENPNAQPNNRSHFDAGKKLHDRLKAEGKPETNPKGKNPGDVFYNSEAKTKDITSPSGSAERTLIDLNTNTERNMQSRNVSAVRGKNPGDVFEINTRPFAKAHFATFPPDLPEKILKCACPKQVCKKCGKPRNPISKPTEDYAKLLGKSWHSHSDDSGKGMTQDRSQKQDAVASYVIVGYTDCGCNAGFKPGIVLDPFFGSGTVGMVADQLGLEWVGIELKEEYAEIAKARVGNQEKLTKHL